MDTEDTENFFTAVNNNQCNKIVEFITAGIDINITTEQEKYTALHIAARLGHLELVILLLKHSANVNARDKYNQTPLHYTAYYGQLEIAMLLLTNGAELDAHDQFGTSLEKAAGKGHNKLLFALIQAGANVNHKSDFGSIALHSAAYYGQLEAMRILLDSGADINWPNNFGKTALHNAAEKGQTTAVELLLDRGSKLELRTSTNLGSSTPLHLAIENRHLNCARVLLDRGSDIHAKTRNGETAIQLAALRGYDEIVIFLLKNNANFSELDGFLPKIVERNHLSVVEFLITNGHDVNTKDMLKQTLLQIAAKFLFKEMLLLLIRYGADINSVDGVGYSALHNAIFPWTRYADEKNMVEIVRLLIECGADCYITDKEDRTPYQQALELRWQMPKKYKRDYTEVFRLFIEFGYFENYFTSVNSNYINRFFRNINPTRSDDFNDKEFFIHLAKVAIAAKRVFKGCSLSLIESSQLKEVAIILVNRVIYRGLPAKFANLTELLADLQQQNKNDSLSEPINKVKETMEYTATFEAAIVKLFRPELPEISYIDYEAMSKFADADPLESISYKEFYEINPTNRIPGNLLKNLLQQREYFIIFLLLNQETADVILYPTMFKRCLYKQDLLQVRTMYYYLRPFFNPDKPINISKIIEYEFPEYLKDITGSVKELIIKYGADEKVLNDFILSILKQTLFVEKNTNTASVSLCQ